MAYGGMVSFPTNSCMTSLSSGVRSKRRIVKLEGGSSQRVISRPLSTSAYQYGMRQSSYENGCTRNTKPPMGLNTRAKRRKVLIFVDNAPAERDNNAGGPAVNLERKRNR